MKKTFFIALTASILCAGCSIDWNPLMTYLANQRPAANLDKTALDDLQKKQMQLLLKLQNLQNLPPEQQQQLLQEVRQLQEQTLQQAKLQQEQMAPGGALMPQVQPGEPQPQPEQAQPAAPQEASNVIIDPRTGRSVAVRTLPALTPEDVRLMFGASPSPSQRAIITYFESFRDANMLAVRDTQKLLGAQAASEVQGAVNQQERQLFNRARQSDDARLYQSAEAAAQARIDDALAQIYTKYRKNLRSN